MTIHKSINPILKTNQRNLFANRDYNANEKWTLRNQFDDTNIYFSNLMSEYNLSIKNYFQTGMLFYDTKLINNNTKRDIYELVKKYPYTRTNEQAIMNLYFIFEKELTKNCQNN